jgi:hypothetical protein
MAIRDATVSNSVQFSNGGMAQEALAKAWRARDRFEPGTNLKAWLFTRLRLQPSGRDESLRGGRGYRSKAAWRALVSPS